MLQQHSSKAFAGSTASLRPRGVNGSRVSRGSLQVQNALTRRKKEEIVQEVKGRLENSVIVFGMRFKGLSVEKQQKFRKGLPEKTSMMVCKNTLMKVACNEIPGWTALGDNGCTGENAWVFVNEEEIPDAIRHFNAFSDELFKAAKAAAPKGTDGAVQPPTAVSCAVMDGKYLTVDEFKRCESLPTKQQLLATIARLIRQPAQKIAVGIKMVPTKLAYGVKALAELDEDKSKLVGDVAKPKAE